MKPDLSNVTLLLHEHARPAACGRMLGAHLDAMNFGGVHWDAGGRTWQEFINWEIWEAYLRVFTSHSLTIHLDGYCLHPELWDPAWLEYDYIGAPWPNFAIGLPSQDYPAQMLTHQVGNGGFCLRTERLMARVAQLPFVEGMGGDVMTCCLHRRLLEGEGYRFAPVEVAARFSVEHPVQETPVATFGFHGPRGKPIFPVWSDDRTTL